MMQLCFQAAALCWNLPLWEKSDTSQLLAAGTQNYDSLMNFNALRRDSELKYLDK